MRVAMKSEIAMCAALLLALGCDRYVEKSKHDATAQQLAETSAQLKAAQTAASAAPTLRYQFQSFGAAHDLMRLDTVTGESCLVNTPRVMQEPKPDIIHQTCDWIDAVGRGSTSAEADCMYVPGVCNFNNATKKSNP